MSGHSKWAQIKHKKALTDAKRGKLFSKMARLISVAAKEKGGDPAMNAKLRMAIENARAIGMPKENIERAIAKVAGAGTEEMLEEVRYEAYGPGGTALIITGITDNKNRTTNEVKHILSERGGKLAPQGSVEWLFKKRGAIDIANESVTIPRDELFLTLIDAGAEDMKEFTEGVTAYVSPESLDALKENLAARGILISRAYIDYAPNNGLSLGEQEQKKLEALAAALEEHDDVQEVYTNAEK